MNCKKLIKTDGTIIEDVIAWESKRFKNCIEFENEQGQVNIIKREDIDTLVEDTEKDDWAVMFQEVIAISVFERIFKSKKTIPKTAQSELISGTSNIFSAWTGNAYENDIYRSAVDAIARNAAKLKGSHVVKYGNHTKCEGDCKLNRLLQVQPNPYMSAFDMLYKLVTHYF